MSDSQIYFFVARNKTAIDAWALAFVLTEMRFRGLAFRMCELLFAAWSIYLHGRDPNITFGRCQVSFGFWRHRFGEHTLSLLLNMENQQTNYQICRDYLNKNRKASVQEMLIQYNGYPSTAYVKIFLKHLALVEFYTCSQQRPITRNSIQSIQN